MGKDEITAILHKHNDILNKYEIRSMFLFGSFARNEQKKGSDIDLIVDFKKPIGLIKYVKLKNELETMLHRKVDMVTKKALKPIMRDQVLREAVKL